MTQPIQPTQQFTQPTQQFIQPPQQFTQPPQQFQTQVQTGQSVYPPQNNFNGLNMGMNSASTFPQQTQFYGQQIPYGLNQQQQPQYGMIGGYPHQPQGIYGQGFQQPMGGYNPYGQVPQYQQVSSNLY